MEGKGSTWAGIWAPHPPTCFLSFLSFRAWNRRPGSETREAECTSLIKSLRPENPDQQCLCSLGKGVAFVPWRVNRCFECSFETFSPSGMSVEEGEQLDWRLSPSFLLILTVSTSLNLRLKYNYVKAFTYFQYVCMFHILIIYLSLMGTNSFYPLPIVNNSSMNIL